FALPKVLNEKFKIDAEQIRYSLWVEVKPQGINNNSNFKLNSIVYKIGIYFFSQVKKNKIDTRKRVFKHFMEEIPHCKEIYDSESISECLKQYQILICGGDQIWNVCNGIQNLNVYTLKFAPKYVRKIAYAPSMAVLEMNNEGKKCMEQGLEELNAISIREKQSINILKTLTDKKIEIVVDPVLLLKEDEWKKELKEPRIRNKYILCYLINDSTMQRKATERIAKKLQFQIVTFPHILANAVRKCDLFFGDIQDYTSGPREFLGLIKNAEFVITDSFHACVFSMIFETPFIVFERNKKGEKGNMNSRIYDFLEEYHLESQLVTEKDLVNMNDIPEIDFTYAQEHWKKRREESLQYLENALKDNLNGAE
ncbi:MAG: polysaccharide pyruvyl transferase family protein, partial [Frisingicoccus sp.]|uniref:polysaccharide pyruvyl transferase family protein n=1 Tax=Frisingicoccus sp. TaxID=1918627 RepID=UPI00262EF6C2